MTEPGGDDEIAAVDGDGLSVPSSPRSIALIRRYAADACDALGWANATDTVLLLVSELATNAVLHAYGPDVRIRVLDLGPRLRVEVYDGSPALPAQRRAAKGDQNGRGLALVEALATTWGTDLTARGKTVWFEVSS